MWQLYLTGPSPSTDHTLVVLIRDEQVFMSSFDSVWFMNRNVSNQSLVRGSQFRMWEFCGLAGG
jgi:hypothetical protein